MAAILTLQAIDGVSVQVEYSVALQSPTIKNIIQTNASGEDRVNVPNVKGNVLRMSMVFIEKRLHFSRRMEIGDANAKGESKAWESEFLDVDKNTLIDLIEAAQFLDIKDLMEMACQKVADTMTGKSVEEIRQLFNIRNDYSREEEEEIKKENPWAFLDK
ncbi:SKP1-like protein 1B [Aristolochia californica]|uniref:SKP1-like protein 1B n=1 Tax=Aristolochia californica TaxID=171875 RepID=UPI0035DB894A